MFSDMSVQMSAMPVFLAVDEDTSPRPEDETPISEGKMGKSRSASPRRCDFFATPPLPMEFSTPSHDGDSEPMMMETPKPTLPLQDDEDSEIPLQSPSHRQHCLSKMMKTPRYHYSHRV